MLPIWPYLVYIYIRGYASAPIWPYLVYIYISEGMLVPILD